MTAFNIETATVIELRKVASRLAIAGRSRMNKAAPQEEIATATAQLKQLAEASQEIGQTMGYAAADAIEFAVDAAQSDEAKALAVKALKGAKAIGWGLVLVSMAALMAVLYFGKACHWAYHLCEQWDSFAEVKPEPDPVLEAVADAVAIAKVLLELLVSRLYGGGAEVMAKVLAGAGLG